MIGDFLLKQIFKVSFRGLDAIFFYERNVEGQINANK
jgi:hypothetical protein